MLVSVITVAYNSGRTIADTIQSVLRQDYRDLEYIIIDGASSDATVSIVKSFQDRIQHFVTEPDQGAYDAINKGIRLARGEIVGILNSDDRYSSDSVLSTVVREFEQHAIDALYADVLIYKSFDQPRIHRYYDASNFSLHKFAAGWMPPHPTFFVKRICYEQFGLYKSDYRIAADFELLVRFLVTHRISYRYLNKVLVHMQAGGLSNRNFRSNWTLNQEIIRACRENGIKTNLLKVLSKYPQKVLQLLKRPSPNHCPGTVE